MQTREQREHIQQAYRLRPARVERAVDVAVLPDQRVRAVLVTSVCPGKTGVSTVQYSKAQRN
jgi:Mrp family chromosome partitioning ATPase